MAKAHNANAVKCVLGAVPRLVGLFAQVHQPPEQTVVLRYVRLFPSFVLPATAARLTCLRCTSVLLTIERNIRLFSNHRKMYLSQSTEALTVSRHHAAATQRFTRYISTTALVAMSSCPHVALYVVLWSCHMPTVNTW